MGLGLGAGEGSQNAKPRIRLATESDLPGLCALIAELFALESDFSVDRAKQAKGLALLMSDGSRGLVLLAEDDGKVLGMVSGQLLASSAEGAWSVLLEDMVVTANARGQGIGADLVAALESWAKERGATRIQLLADHGNQAALGFYSRLGFSTTRMVALRKTGL